MSVVAVIGLGYVGLPLVIEFGKHGRTIGFDISVSKVDSCLRGVDPSRELSDEEMRASTHAVYTADPSMLAEADFIVVAVPTPVDAAHIPDFLPINLRLAFSPPRWKLRLARVVMRFFPHHSQPTGMRLDRLTRDEAHVEAMPDRALMHHRISARMFFAVHAASERAMAEAERVRTPLLLLHGDADPVTCCRTTAEFHERVSVTDKALRIFPGGLHELHNDVIREDVLREVGDWVAARC